MTYSYVPKKQEVETHGHFRIKKSFVLSVENDVDCSPDHEGMMLGMHVFHIRMKMNQNQIRKTIH